jgi:transcriptional repressor NrdR
MIRCPKCDGSNVKVIDSRATDAGRQVRRRRHCHDCRLRFTTYEVVDTKSLSPVPFIDVDASSGIGDSVFVADQAGGWHRAA